MSNFNFNKVIIGGRLTKDIEIKQTPSGVAVTQFSVAVNRRGKDAQTDFLDCVAWRQTAEFIGKYFRKGSSICVVGNLQKREWRDKDGNKRYATEVIVDEAMFVDGKNDAQDAGTGEGMPYMPDAYKEPQGAKYEEVKGDDDLPF